ncbi:MAG: RDD family protein [Chloroflexi bacterium]|nr:RDD family protein [Chloroflexota bacterium]
MTDSTIIERHEIETPENISFGYEIAGLGSRFLASLIDSLIQAALYLALLIGIMAINASDLFKELPMSVQDWLVALVLLVLFLIQFGYFFFFEIILNGQSPGKRALGLRVVKENGYPLSVLDALIRNIVRVIDFFPFAYGVGVIVMFSNSRAKRLGDFAAGTVVVKLKDSIKLSDLEVKRAPVSDSADVPGVARLKEADVEMIESFLQRRAKLRNADALAQTLRQTILTRVDDAETRTLADALAPVEFLSRVVATYRARQ